MKFPKILSRQIKPAILMGVVSLLIFDTSCNKGDSSGTNSGTNDTSTAYSINGLHDINLGLMDSTLVPLAIAYAHGTQGNVDLSVSGLPAGVTATFQTSSGIPSFTTILTFKSGTGVTTGGTFPITLKATSTVMGNKSLSVNLVLPNIPVDCRTNLPGIYKATVYSSGSSPVTHDDTLSNNIQSTDGMDFSSGTFFHVNCTAKTINVPITYENNGIVNYFTGHGTISGDTLIIVKIYDTVIGTKSDSTVYTKK